MWYPDKVIKGGPWDITIGTLNDAGAMKALFGENLNTTVVLEVKVEILTDIKCFSSPYKIQQGMWLAPLLVTQEIDRATASGEEPQFWRAASTAARPSARRRPPPPPSWRTPADQRQAQNGFDIR